MTLAQKLRYLRLMEGQLRGLNREMTQKELVGAINTEFEGSLSQPYISQLERGSRKHLTGNTRLLLAKFFKVHPGYLVDDPEGFRTEIMSDLADEEDKLDLWLVAGAERFEKDKPLREALLRIAEHADTRGCVLLLAKILETPAMAIRLQEALGGECFLEESV